MKALGTRDIILTASRKAYQKLDKDCKKAVALTFRKLIIREREAATARENVLLKLEIAVDNINTENDRPAIKAEQLAWIKQRNACLTSGCVVKSYTQRLKELVTLQNVD